MKHLFVLMGILASTSSFASTSAARCTVAAKGTRFELISNAGGTSARVYQNGKLAVHSTQFQIEDPVRFIKEEYRKETLKQAQRDFGISPALIERFVHIKFTDTKKAELYSVFMFRVDGELHSGWFVGPYKNDADIVPQQLCRKL